MLVERFSGESSTLKKMSRTNKTSRSKRYERNQKKVLRHKKHERLPPANSMIDTQVRKILMRWKLSSEIVELYLRSGVGRTLIDLRRDGFKCSEKDPLLLLCPVLKYYEWSVAYLSGGNYALPANAPGHATWPECNDGGGKNLEPGISAAPSSSLGSFIDTFDGARNVTVGAAMNVFYLRDMEAFFDIDLAVRNSPQFSRIGGLHAAALNVQEEESMVHALLLQKVNGIPIHVSGFTIS
ncbi:unnamed protein product [Phytophthora lilii]|uniref:Unnamed protein product n=1 Tax=Phytophthora lilii TaxID=2077276 RepID=A0A9W6TJ33_9STRA|nr:unnamed protein product [Phytophthora lilii]